MLVETAINMLLLKFNYIGRPDFSFWQLHLIMDVYDFFFFFPIPTPSFLDCGSQSSWSFGGGTRQFTAAHIRQGRFMLVQILRKADSFGQKQENRLIEFPSKVRSLCKLCTTSISPSNNPMWHKVCGFFLYFRRLDFRFGPFVFFRFRFDF